jgi:hypothetical protein
LERSWDKALGVAFLHGISRPKPKSFQQKFKRPIGMHIGAFYQVVKIISDGSIFTWELTGLGCIFNAATLVSLDLNQTNGYACFYL